MRCPVQSISSVIASLTMVFFLISPNAQCDVNSASSGSGPRSYLSDAETEKLYKGVTANRIPEGTQVSFNNWLLPAGSRCSDSKDIPNSFVTGQTFKDTGKPVASSCIICAKSPINKSLTFGTYTTTGDSKNDEGDVSLPEHDLSFNFKGQNGSTYEVNCTFPSGTMDLVQIKKELQKIGVTLKFEKPQTATLLPSDTHTDGTPVTD